MDTVTIMKIKQLMLFG